MPILRKRDINQMLPEERTKKITELRAELTTIRTSVKAGGTVENPARIREMRKTVARLLTSENARKTAPVQETE
ncbi:MAG TPA: 50S ribosomal protein L29 [Candidatus Bathyarchaeia archaeon]|nr:50S ribosomal protein L29 [Candidatus Bathyarchaeia archaeon]